MQGRFFFSIHFFKLRYLSEFLSDFNAYTLLFSGFWQIFQKWKKFSKILDFWKISVAFALEKKFFWKKIEICVFFWETDKFFNFFEILTKTLENRIFSILVPQMWFFQKIGFFTENSWFWVIFAKKSSKLEWSSSSEFLSDFNASTLLF